MPALLTPSSARTTQYPGLAGPVTSLNTAASTATSTPGTKGALGGLPGGFQDPVANFAATGNPFGKGKKGKKATSPVQNKIYRKGLQTLQAYNALLDPTQALLRAAAEGDLEQFRALAPGYVDAISNADPMQARARTALNRTAMEEMALGSRLDPTELRRVQQYSRMNRTSGGVGQGSENDLFNEALDISTRGRELYDRRFGNLMGVSRLNLAATGDPLLAVTGRPSGVRGLGDVPEDARNLYLTSERERANKKAAEDANRTALYGAGISAVGSAAGGGLSAI